MSYIKFGIIVCSKCKKAKGIDLSFKTTRCPRCGKIITIEKMKILFRTDSQKKLRDSIGLINAEIEGKSIELRKSLVKKL